MHQKPTTSQGLKGISGDPAVTSPAVVPRLAGMCPDNMGQAANKKGSSSHTTHLKMRGGVDSQLRMPQAAAAASPNIAHKSEKQSEGSRLWVENSPRKQWTE